jgi:hypothetical protein
MVNKFSRSRNGWRRTELLRLVSAIDAARFPSTIIGITGSGTAAQATSERTNIRRRRGAGFDLTAAPRLNILQS